MINTKVWGHDSGVEHLPIKHKVLGSIPSTGRTKELTLSEDYGSWLLFDLKKKNAFVYMTRS